MATREGLKRTSLAIAEAVESIGRRLAHSRGRLINAGYRDPALPNWVESEFAPDQIHDWLEPWFTKNDRPERQLIRWSDVAEGSLLRRYVTEDELPDVPTHGKCVVMPMNWRSKPWAILWLLKINASQVFEGLAEIYLKERERERQEKLAAEREARLRDPHERIRTLELRLQQMGVDFGDLAFVGPVVTTNTTTTRDFFGG
jgi:hypothetical protein